MSAHEAVRRVQFCAGHRVYRHESKCANLHGHNYVALFYARASRLDTVGRVVDFSVLKGSLGGWIEANWDHGFVLAEFDQDAIRAMQAVRNQKVYLMPTNPTAENMAHYLLDNVAPKMLKGTGVEIFRVELWETENCMAAMQLPEPERGPHWEHLRD